MFTSHQCLLYNYMLCIATSCKVDTGLFSGNSSKQQVFVATLSFKTKQPYESTALASDFLLMHGTEVYPVHALVVSYL